MLSLRSIWKKVDLVVSIWVGSSSTALPKAGAPDLLGRHAEELPGLDDSPDASSGLQWSKVTGCQPGSATGFRGHKESATTSKRCWQLELGRQQPVPSVPLAELVGVPSPSVSFCPGPWPILFWHRQLASGQPLLFSLRRSFARRHQIALDYLGRFGPVQLLDAPFLLPA